MLANVTPQQIERYLFVNICIYLHANGTFLLKRKCCLFICSKQ